MSRLLAAALAATVVLGGCDRGPTPSSTLGATGSPVPAATPGATTDRAAEVILRGGNVITMDAGRPRAEAVAVGDGRIIGVGSDAEMSALEGSATRIVDLAGRTVTPGFIDAHAHRLTNGVDVLGIEPAEMVDMALRQGLTTLHELYIDAGQLAYLRSLDEEGVLRLRVSAYWPANENSPEGRPLGGYFDAYPPGERVTSRIRVAGLKVFTDFDNAQILLWDEAELEAFLAARYEGGWHVAIKTVSAESLDLILAALRSIEASVPGTVAGTRLEHMLFATPAQIAEIASLGLVPAINLNAPGQLVGDPDIDALVERNPDGSYVPWRSLFDAGIPAAGISGFPSFYVDEPSGAPFGSPIHLIYQAVTRVGNLGVMSPRRLLDQAITAEDALRALTINAAAAALESDETGSLTPGKFADLVVLSDDPLGVAPEAINDIRVQLTMIDGIVEWCDPDAGSLCDPGGPRPDSTDGRPTASGGAPTIDARASAALPDGPPEHAVDGDRETAWISGDDAEQWLEIDLGAPFRLELVRLNVAQTPSGPTVHELLVGPSEAELTLIHTFDGVTADQDVLEFRFPPDAPPIRVIRIVTTVSPSWVAWREIEVERAAP